MYQKNVYVHTKNVLRIIKDQTIYKNDTQRDQVWLENFLVVVI